MNKYSWTIYSWTIHNTYWLILSDIMHSIHPLLLLTIIESATFHQMFFKGLQRHIYLDFKKHLHPNKPLSQIIFTFSSFLFASSRLTKEREYCLGS